MRGVWTKKMFKDDIIYLGFFEAYRCFWQNRIAINVDLDWDIDKMHSPESPLLYALISTNWQNLYRRDPKYLNNPQSENMRPRREAIETEIGIILQQNNCVWFA